MQFEFSGGKMISYNKIKRQHAFSNNLFILFLYSFYIHHFTFNICLVGGFFVCVGVFLSFLHFNHIMKINIPYVC